MKKLPLLCAPCPFLLAVLTLVGCSSAPTAADRQTAADAARQAADNSVLRVGVSPQFPPMVFKQQGELTGVEVELARALATKLGRKLVFVEEPWENQFDALIAGKTDIIMSSVSITPTRNSIVNFTQPYFVIGQTALVRREDSQQYAFGFPLLPRGTIGVIKGTTGDFLAQRDFPRTNRKTFNSGDEAARALARKKVDLFISDSSLVFYLAGMYANDGVSVVPIMLSEEQLGWVVRKGDDALLASANEFITQSKQDGLLLKVFRRWTAVGN